MAIVCGTDFSANAAAGLSAAGALAARLGDRELWLVHVLDSVSTAELDSVEWDQLRTRTRERLAAEAQRLRERFSLTRVHPMVLAGSTSGVLAEFAKVKGAAVLVVGSKGHATSLLFNLGGTSERVAVDAQVPVLVVRDGSAFEDWVGGVRALRLVVGVDWTASSAAAVRLVKLLRSAGPCEVVAAHVYYRDEVAGRYGIAPLGSWLEADKETEALLARDVASRVGDLGGHGAVTFKPKLGFGRRGDHLIEVAAAEKADLIILGTHRKRGLKRLASVASVVLHFSNSSVACAPEGATPQGEPPPIRCVLIPTDLSALSNHAIPAGYGLLGDQGGEIHLLHVASDQVHVTLPQRDPELLAALRALVPEWAAKKGITTRTEVVHHASVARGVVEKAARVGADVICMGSHGRSGLGRMVLGSVAEEVVRESAQPVLIVRPPPA